MGLSKWLVAVVAGLLVLPALTAAATTRELQEDQPKQPAPAAGDPKKSNIVPTAGEATLTNGIGDVLPDGPCKPDIAAFCKDTSVGDARLASCLTQKLKADKQGNTAGRTVSDNCAEDLVKFKIDRSLNINKDLALARACKDDVVKMCTHVNDGPNSPGSVVACLRDKRKHLNQACKQEVFRTMLEAAEDYRLDPKLYAACRSTVEARCKDATPGTGAAFECLTENTKSLAWGCLEQVARVQREDGDDIRLSTRLFRACLNDQKKFCKDVEPGHMRVQDCLEDSVDKSGFSPNCKKELEDVIAARVADFSLDTGMREACEADLKETCGANLADMDADPNKKKSALQCLQSYREELSTTSCKERVKRAMKRAARDIRFDDVLANSCQEDRKNYCNDVQPGSARVIRCLQEHRTNLSSQCAAALFDHEVKMAEDIDFKYPMRKACAWEIASFCKGVPHGHARIIRCLQKSLDHEDMSKECSDEVARDANRAAQDYRLNWRLNHACSSDIQHLCAGMCHTAGGGPCGGVVLQCLQDLQENITSSECQEEVFYYQLMEVSDFRNDVILAEACRADVEKYCKDVEPGQGRVHQCLRFHRSYISDRCRDEEMKLAAIEYRDIRLRPKLAKVCSEERAVYCKEVKPGKARVIKCLMENMAAPNFGDECRGELEKREDAVRNDYRYDAGVAQNCAADIDRVCADAKTKLRGNATVLKCLVENHSDTGAGCQEEMSRAVRFALWDYKPGAALTAVCDDDVANFCPKNSAKRPGGMFTIGAIGRCLSKSLVQGDRLAGKCRQLVLVAAPKDSRVYLQYPESTSALIAKIADMQRAAGLEAVLVDPYARSGSTVTVTGWAAAACVVSLVVVAIGTLVLAYRRLTGQDKPHTQYVKSGDA